MIHPPSSVLIIGSATVDTIAQNNRRTRKIGGVVTYAGLTFRKLGADVTVLSNISPKDKCIFQLYDDSGIKLIRGETLLTTRFVNHLEGDYRWQEMPKKAKRINPKKYYPFIKTVPHIHLGPLHPEDFHPELLDFLADLKCLVTLDLQGYIRRIQNGRVTAGVSKHLHAALIATDILKSSIRELETVLDTFKIEADDLVRNFKLKELIVTSGRGGGYVLTSKGVKIEFEAKRIKEELDPTGAGDVFFSAYLFNRFYKEQSIQESLDQASTIAAKQVSGEFIPFDKLSIKSH